MYIKLIKHDIKNGIIRRYKRYFILFFIAILMCIQCKSIIDLNVESGAVIGSGSFLDYIVYIFKGIPPFNPSEGQGFEFPTLWILIFVLSLYFSLTYPYEELSQYGQQILLKIGGRNSWWITKCFYICYETLLYFLVIYFGVGLFVVFFTKQLSFEINLDIIKCFIKDIGGTEKGTFILGGAKVVFLLLTPYFVSVALNLMQFAIGVVIRPLFGFGIMSIFLILSSYFSTSVLFPNIAMLARSQLIHGEGKINIYISCAMCLLVIILSFIIGRIKFRKYNIL